MKVETPKLISGYAQISPDGRYRYSLSRYWGSDGDNLTGHLTWVMLNPSTADAMIDDPTIRKCFGFSWRNGFAGMTVVNLFAYRATKPADLWKADRDIIGPETDSILLNFIPDWMESSDRVVLAWGANAENERGRARIERVLELLESNRALLLRLGQPTKGGSPRHPLMLPYSTPLELWTL